MNATGNVAPLVPIGTTTAQRIARLIASTGRSFTEVSTVVEAVDRYLAKHSIDQEAAWEGCTAAAAGIEEAAQHFSTHTSQEALGRMTRLG